MNIRRLVVMEDNKLKGIVTQTDIFMAVKNKLQQEETKNLKILDNSESNIYTIDMEGNTNYLNPAFLKLLEITEPDEVIEKPFLPEKFWANTQDRTDFLQELQNGTIETRELALKTAQGKTIKNARLNLKEVTRMFLEGTDKK